MVQHMRGFVEAQVKPRSTLRVLPASRIIRLSGLHCEESKERRPLGGGTS